MWSGLWWWLHRDISFRVHLRIQVFVFALVAKKNHPHTKVCFNVERFATCHARSAEDRHWLALV